MAKAASAKPGRPPRGPKSGKGATLATRITAETRRALDEEAARTGRSVSQVAEIWLDEARNGRAQYLQLIGGDPATATAIEKLVEIKRAVQGSSIAENLKPGALLAAWQATLPEVLPSASADRKSLALALDQLELQRRCAAVLAVLLAREEADPGDQVVRRASQPLGEAATGSVTTGGLFALGMSLEPVYLLLSSVERFPSKRIVQALEALQSAGTTAAREIGEALEVGRRASLAETAMTELTRQAQEYGRAIAQAATRRAQ